ncbi:MAG: hypothetical protein WDM77_00260 [Steroidobacteraceae bacterium]
MIDRRSVIGGTVAVGALATRITRVLADDAPATPAVVATTAGKIRGTQAGGGLRLQGCSLWRHDGRGRPVPAACQAETLVRRSRGR